MGVTHLLFLMYTRYVHTLGEVRYAPQVYVAVSAYVSHGYPVQNKTKTKQSKTYKRQV